MKPQNTRTIETIPSKLDLAQAERDLKAMTGQEVENVSVSGFLRRIPNDRPWELNNVIRFGSLLGRAGDAFHVAYQSVFDPALGNVQTFPIKLVERVYDHLGQTLNWPQIIDANPRLLGGPSLRATLRVKTVLAGHLRHLALDAVDEQVRAAATLLLQVTEQECAAIRREIGDAEIDAQVA